MRFISFTTGHRPDILDTAGFSIGPNPLEETQTGVEWTHVLGGRVGDRYLLLIEKVQGGIWPTTLERYLQWLVDEYTPEEEASEESADEEPITVSVEAEPGDEFIQRLDSLTRITRATVRRVRPNPGWADLESELAHESESSDAHRVEVGMTARRRRSLRRESGIIAAIRRLFRERRLDYAAIEGERGSTKEKFTTARLGRVAYLSIEVDERGQAVHQDVWRKLSELMDELE